jgi:hypothetical protein
MVLPPLTSAAKLCILVILSLGVWGVVWLAVSSIVSALLPPSYWLRFGPLCGGDRQFG